MSELKPCPACDGVHVWKYDEWVECTHPKCMLIGPRHDPDGSKWNTLPRRSDTEALRNELIGVLTQIKTSDIGGRYAGIGQRIDELVKEGTV